MIKGVHAMFYSSEPEALREFLRDKLGFDSYTDVGGGWLIFDLPEADMGVHPADPSGEHGAPAGTPTTSPSTATISMPRSRSWEAAA